MIRIMAVHCCAVGLLMLLCHYTLLSTAEEGFWSINPPSIPGLYCTSQGFQYVVPTKRHRLISVKFSALDKKGSAQVLSNSRNCGTWILRNSSGSVTLHSSYDGCYVYEQDYNNKMMLLIERELVSGEWMHPQIKELKCPKLEALNRSAPDHCSVVPLKERIACAASPISRCMCTKQGCCFDSEDQINPCYYGHKVTVRCTKDALISIAVSKDLTQPPLRLDSIHMMKGRDAACSPTLRTSGFVLFQFSLSACGTTSSERDGTVSYENIMVAETDNVRSQNVTAAELGSPLRLHIQCSLNPSVPSAQNTGVLVPSSPLPDAGPKPSTLQMRFAKDDLYMKYYIDGEYPVVKQPQDPIPVEVRILQSTELNFTLTLHQCWATPTEDSEHELKWLFLDNGCPFTGDNNMSQEISPATYNGLSFHSQYKRFLIHVNHTERSLKVNGLVYFHCRASACPHDALEPCISLCQQGNQRPVREAARNMTILVSSKGPVYFPPAQESNMFGKGSPVPSEPMDKEWVRIVTVVGVLSVILGVIYVVKRRSRASDVKN
ncbi:zona pellucida sperm-binding protein 4-like [Pseudophryne corroboree]|uniref:zona pellucida sperm-binding protein 4-like n=1 Tax=Pseudophryne corroboree TaxID=495146 RepID=UPI00308140B5